jgi:hypothetical protein
MLVWYAWSKYGWKRTHLVRRWHVWSEEPLALPTEQHRGRCDRGHAGRARSYHGCRRIHAGRSTSTTGVVHRWSVERGEGSKEGPKRELLAGAKGKKSMCTWTQLAQLKHSNSQASFKWLVYWMKEIAEREPGTSKELWKRTQVGEWQRTKSWSFLMRASVARA